MVRTDLAVELNESVDKSDSRYKGIIVREKKDAISDIKITTLEILNEEGEKLFNRSVGTYVTVEAENLVDCNEGYSERLIKILENEIYRLAKPCIVDNRHILVIGLGNRDVTADSLGPWAADKLLVNRHIVHDKSMCLKMSSLTPGVMAQTGMETAEIIKGIVKQTRPGLVIAIDALAARSIKRLNSTIQISNRGISPGSGVGNHREGITAETIGAPVLAIGVPTVIDAATIISDYSDGRELPNYLSNMYVAPKDVDACVSSVAEIIAESLNRVVYSYN